jgi:hypothetical protein
MIYLAEKCQRNGHNFYPKCTKTRAIIHQRLFHDASELYVRILDIANLAFSGTNQVITPQHKMNLRKNLQILEVWHFYSNSLSIFMLFMLLLFFSNSNSLKVTSTLLEIASQYVTLPTCHLFALLWYSGVFPLRYTAYHTFRSFFHSSTLALTFPRSQTSITGIGGCLNAMASRNATMALLSLASW